MLTSAMFLELTLAVADKSPVIIEHGARATFITGSVDYAILSTFDSQKKVAVQLGFNPQELSAGTYTT